MQPCQVHDEHRPHPLRTVEHHIQPQAMGGPDTLENKVWTCDTGHYNIHRLMGQIETQGHMAGHEGTARERVLAQQGYAMWVDAGKPGTFVFQLGTMPSE